MKYLLFLAFLVPYVLVADELIPTELRDALIERREAVKKWAITCPPGPWEGSYTHTDGVCHQGDSTMFAGLACLAATLAEDEETAKARCSDVARSQGPEGRWYRGPSLVGVPYPGSFSRDQSRGVFAYLLALGHVRQDPESEMTARVAATKWWDWITHEGDWKICPEEIVKCQITSGVENMMFNTFRHFGALPPYSAGWEARKLYKSKWYLRWGILEEIPLLFIETHLRGKWYTPHLKASSILIYRVQNMDFPEARVRNRRIARVLGKAARRVHRFDPDNLLYDFLRNGNRVSLVQKVLERCPAQKPGPLLGNLHDWAWQRHTSEKAWERSDGHDIVYLINLMLARMNGRLNW